MMHGRPIVAEALVLRSKGLGAKGIARQLDLPVATVRDWLGGRLPRHSRVINSALPDTCKHCGHAGHRFDQLPAEYVYLLGLYLGDA
jgi:hypothetical protein